MKQEKERQRELEGLHEALNQVTEEYQEYFNALATLPPIEPPVTIETVNTTTPYRDPENAGFE